LELQVPRDLVVRTVSLGSLDNQVCPVQLATLAVRVRKVGAVTTASKARSVFQGRPEIRDLVEVRAC